MLETTADSFIKISIVMTNLVNTGLKPLADILKSLTSNNWFDWAVGGSLALLLVNKAITGLIGLSSAAGTAMGRFAGIFGAATEKVSTDTQAIIDQLKVIQIELGTALPDAAAAGAAREAAAQKPVIDALQEQTVVARILAYTYGTTIPTEAAVGGARVAGIFSAEGAVGVALAGSLSVLSKFKTTLLDLAGEAITVYIVEQFIPKNVTTKGSSLLDKAGLGFLNGVPLVNKAVESGAYLGNLLGTGLTHLLGGSSTNYQAQNESNLAYLLAHPIPTVGAGAGTSTSPFKVAQAHINTTLPTSLKNALNAAAVGHGNLTALTAQAYDFFNKQLGQKGLTVAQQQKLYAAEAPYFNTAYGTPSPLPASIPTNLNANVSGRAFFSTAQQARMAAALQNTAGISASSSPTSNNITALMGEIAQTTAELTKLKKSVQAGAYSGTELANAQAELTTLTRQQVAARKLLVNQRENLTLEKLLGIAGPTSQTGGEAARSSTASLRTFLNGILKQFGLAQTGSAPLGPFVTELYKLGDINKRQYTSLEKILTSIKDMKKDTSTISSSVTGNLAQRLAEIKQELQAQTGFTLTGAQHSLSGLLGASGARLSGTAAQRSRFLEQGQYALAHNGQVLTNAGAALGVPSPAAVLPPSRVSI